MREDPVKHAAAMNPAIFDQRRIWVDSSKTVWAIEDLPDGHLDNLIKWIRQYKDAIDHSDVLQSPLFLELLAEQKKRIPKRNLTPRQALKDTLLNDYVTIEPRSPKSVDILLKLIIEGLSTRGFEIRKKNV